MFAAIIVIIIIWLCMWAFYKFMYPRAPKSMMPKEGDVTTPRQCNFCGNYLAEYRGVVEALAPIKSQNATLLTDSNSTVTTADSANEQKELFFCNYEHQADFHAGKTYQ